MAIFVVSISSDSSEESVGTSTVRVILFGMVYTAIPATVPIIYPPVVHDDTPLILTETPTIPPVVSTLPHNSPFMYGELGSQRIMEMEHDIENMTLNEYLEYEAEKERRL
ncbi:hypothetical protein Tco_0580107 [Tanacetum coccineum]